MDSRPRALLLDLDDTVFDFLRAEALAFEACLPGPVPMPVAELFEAYQRINASLWLDVEAGRIRPAELKSERFRRLADGYAFSRGWDAVALGQAYLERLSEQTGMLPGAAEACERLAQGFALAAVTNGLTDVQRPRLERSGLGRHFRAIVISEEFGQAKPEPGIFLEALKRLGITDPREALMIGDRLETDVLGAQRAGIPSCWLNASGAPNRTAIRPEHEARSLAELADRLLG